MNNKNADQRTVPASVLRLKKLLARPPIVELETVNVCNSRCTFCLYKHRLAKKALMDEAFFVAVSRQISASGTGELCLVPMLGDPLLDDNIVTHASFLKQLGNMDKIRLVTNGIAFDRHSDEKLIELFSVLDVLEISIGPNREVYHQMFGVDRFEHVMTQLERVCRMMEQMPRKPERVQICGRACGEDFVVDPRLPGIEQHLCNGIKIIWTRAYMDWGGAIKDLPLSTPVIRTNISGTVSVPCYYSLSPHIYHDGRVGLCACAGADDSLLIGTLRTQTWQQILGSPQRLETILSFLDGAMPEYCAKCSFYFPASNLDWEAARKFFTATGKEK